nr:hypothetical protein [Bartonella sp. AU16XJBT]
MWNNDKGAFIAQHGEGEGKTNSKITFLANGDITENSTDAINGSQLYLSPTRLMKQKVMLYCGTMIKEHLSLNMVKVKEKPIARLLFLPMVI